MTCKTRQKPTWKGSIYATILTERPPDIKSLLGIAQLAARVCCCLLHRPINSGEEFNHRFLFGLSQSPGKGEVAEDLDESHLCLKHGESHTNAGSRTLTKAQKGVPAWMDGVPAAGFLKYLRTPAGFGFLAEVVRVENCGVGEVFWIAVNPWSVDNDHASLLQLDVGEGGLVAHRLLAGRLRRVRQHPRNSLRTLAKI